MGKIIIFGATGSVGVYTSLMLKQTGMDVVAVGHRKDDNGFFAAHGIPYLSVDIRSREAFAALPQSDVEAVLHFAGAMPARMQGYDPYQYVDSIVTGTLNVLEYMRRTACPKIVFTQSIADILYRFGTRNPIEDDAERRFPLATDHSVYSISKNAAVDLIEHYHAQYGIRRFILRLPTIYVYHPNPFYYVDGQKRWMGYRYIIDRAVKGETLEIWGDPNSIKEMVYVKDFVQLVHRCLLCRGEGGIYNVGCGNPVSIEYQIRQIAEVFNGERKSEIVYRPDKPSSPQFVLSIEKARRELGYEPRYDFRQLLLDFKADMIAEPFARLWGRSKEYEL